MAVSNGFILYSSSLNQIYCNQTIRSADTSGEEYLWILKMFPILVHEVISLEMENISHYIIFQNVPFSKKFMNFDNHKSDSQWLGKAF